jgi:hypothetical protein
MGHIIIQAKGRKEMGNLSRMKGRLLRREDGKEGLKGHLSMGLDKDWDRETKSQYIIKEQVFCILSGSRQKLSRLTAQVEK